MTAGGEELLQKVARGNPDKAGIGAVGAGEPIAGGNGAVYYQVYTGGRWQHGA